MLSIKPIGGSARQIGYYTQLGDEDYYTQGGEPPGRWWGTGAKRLGLSGQVEASQFAGLLRGYLTTTGGKQKLVQNAGRPDRRSGFDLTFSAPKSVSVLWSLSDQQQRREIESCLQQAVTKALEAFVELCGQTRRGKQGLQVEPADLAVAMFRHETARGVEGGAPDPHLHWHAVVCNLSVRADGSTGSFDARRLFQPHMKMLLGALFRAELARELQQIGLEVYRPTNDRGKRVSWFELSCVPPKLVKAFSKRRQVVQKWLNERSLEGTRAAERAAVATRTRKTSHTRDQLLAAWQEVGREHRFNARESLSLQPNNAHRDGRREGELAIQEALKEITEQRARFSELELLRYTAQAAQGRSLGIDEIFELVEQTIHHSPVLVRLRDSDGEHQYTTREMLAVEQRLFRAVARLHHEDSSKPTAVGVEQTLSAYPTVRKEQAVAVRHITQQTNRIACVNGLAGTGKTFAMQVAREIWEQAGNTVLGTTLAAKASQTLQAGSGIESLHLHPLLHQLATGQRELTDQHVVVLDEAGMVGTRQMEQLTARVAAAGAKLVLVGDHRQLSAIEAGSPFRGIAERIGTVELNEITRQREGWARQAVVEFSQGQAVAALKKYADRGLLFVGDERESAMERLVADWLPLFQSHPQQTLIFAGTRLEVAHLNHRCQQLRRGVGELTGESVTVDRRTFFVGDRVLCTRNKPSLLLKNGSTGTVVEVDSNTQLLRVRLDDGYQVRIDTQLYPHLDLGYALSTHKGQGLTVESALILTGDSMTDRELTYVQTSRARGQTRLYTDKDSSGEELAILSRQMQHSRAKELAHDFLLEAV